MEIPEGWKEGKIADLISRLDAGVSVNSGDRPANADEQAILKTSCVSEWVFDPCQNKVVTSNAEKSRLKEPVQSNSIIISRMNTPALVGASAYIESDYTNLFLPDRLWQAKPLNNSVCTKWLANFLGSRRGRFTLSSLATGTSGTMKNITKPDVFSMRILIPPLPEQKKIAEILSTWDRAIEVVEGLIENSQAQKKALMQQLLTGKKRLPGFDGEWETIRLKSVLHEEKTRNRNNQIQKVLSITNHSGFVLPEEQFSKRVASKNVTNYNVVKKGQYGYNPSRLNVGSFARLDKHDIGILSPMYVVFSVDEKVLNSDYFLSWMSTNEANQRIISNAQGSVRDSVGFNVLCSFPFKLPPFDEQTAIAAILSDADREIQLQQNQLQHLKSEKSALMQQLLTGKRRVKIDKEAAA